MRALRRLLVRVAVFALFTTSATALERVARPIEASRPDAWDSGGTATIRYYNLCNGWIWVLGGFPPDAWFGIVVDAPSSGGVLGTSWHYVFSGVPVGWGFTGTISVSGVDAADCPAGTPLARQAFAPHTGWNAFSWNIPVPMRFALHVVARSYGQPTPLAMGLDHPGPVEGGPPACGSCYPATRVNHSWDWGTTGAPLCPPSPLLFDGWCDAQLLWDCDLGYPSAAGPPTWGQIKALYR